MVMKRSKVLFDMNNVLKLKIFVTFVMKKAVWHSKGESSTGGIGYQSGSEENSIQCTF